MTTPVTLDLSVARPDPHLLPDLAEHLAAAAQGPWNYPPDVMLPELATVLAADWPFRPQALAVASGGHAALDQIATTVLQPHDRVVVEEVTAGSLLDIIDDKHCQPLPVPCDDAGLKPTPRRPHWAVGRGWCSCKLGWQARTDTR